MTAVLPERTTAPVLTSVLLESAASPAAPHPAACPCDTCVSAGTGAADLMARLAVVPGDRTAVVAGDRELSFDQLRERASAFAAGLARLGVGPESVVALCLPRGADLVTAIIGTLAAGAAYLPVDPALPEERRRMLVEDSGAGLMVADGSGPVFPGLRTVTPDGLSASAPDSRPPGGVVASGAARTPDTSSAARSKSRQVEGVHGRFGGHRTRAPAAPRW